MSFDPHDNGDFTKKTIYEDFDPAILVEKGLELQAIAMALAAPHVKTGEFEGSFDGFLEYASDGHPYYRVTNTDPASVSIEFGTAKTAGQHILGRAGDALGNDRAYPPSVEEHKAAVAERAASENVSARIAAARARARAAQRKAERESGQ